MRFNSLMVALASFGAAARGMTATIMKRPGSDEQHLLQLAPDTWGMHRYSAPNPTGALRIQRAARKRRNQRRHRRARRG